ncbi:MAG: PAS domain-containing protein [Caulobacterales bacterium]
MTYSEPILFPTALDVVDARGFLASLSNKIEGFFYRCLNDADYTMLYLSGGFDRMLGRSGADLVKSRSSYSELTHGNDLRRVMREIDSALDEHRSWRVVYRLRRADETYIPVLETGGGVFDPKTGELKYLDGVILDLNKIA